jgi:hypothetical protein
LTKRQLNVIGQQRLGVKVASLSLVLKDAEKDEAMLLERYPIQNWPTLASLVNL